MLDHVVQVRLNCITFLVREYICMLVGSLPVRKPVAQSFEASYPVVPTSQVRSPRHLPSVMTRVSVLNIVNMMLLRTGGSKEARDGREHTNEMYTTRDSEMTAEANEEGICKE